MENNEIKIEKVEALIAKVKRGAKLEDSEKQYLREYRNIEAYHTREGGIDFAAAQRLTSPLDEGNFIREQNRRFAEVNPHARGPYWVGGPFGSFLISSDQCIPRPASFS